MLDMNLQQRGSCQLGAYFPDRPEDFSGGLFSRKRNATFVCAHLTFVHSGELGESADIYEIEEVEKRRDVVAVLNHDIVNAADRFAIVFPFRLIGLGLSWHGIPRQRSG